MKARSIAFARFVVQVRLAVFLGFVGVTVATPSHGQPAFEFEAEVGLAVSFMDGSTLPAEVTFPVRSDAEARSVCVWIEHHGGQGAGGCDGHPRHLWWRVETSLMGVYGDLLELRVRTDRHRGSTLEETFEETFLASLGQDRTLDFQRSQDTGAGPLHARVRLSAQRQVPTALAHRPLELGLWMVHEDPTGTRHSQPLTLSAKPGQSIPFAFSEFRIPSATVEIDGNPFEVLLSVEGNVENWPRAVDHRSVVLAANFSVAHNQSSGTTGRGTGRKLIELTSGQAVEVKLPKPTVSYVARRPPGNGALEWASFVLGGGPFVHRVDLPELLRGHRFYLVVEAR